MHSRTLSQWQTTCTTVLCCSNSNMSQHRQTVQSIFRNITVAVIKHTNPPELACNTEMDIYLLFYKHFFWCFRTPHRSQDLIIILSQLSQVTRPRDMNLILNSAEASLEFTCGDSLPWRAIIMVWTPTTRIPGHYPATSLNLSKFTEHNLIASNIKQSTHPSPLSCVKPPLKNKGCTLRKLSQQTLATDKPRTFLQLKSKYVESKIRIQKPIN